MLSREMILTAAETIVDDEGLAALSMRRVGEALAVEAMSLYNHVPNKAALLDGVYERIVSRIEPAPKTRTWMDHARHQGRAFRMALSEHPNAIPLFASRPATAPEALLRLEGNLAVLRQHGLDPLQALSVVQTVLAFVVGHALWSLVPETPDELETPRYESLNPKTFPNVRAVGSVLESYDPEAEFETGLDALVDGLARVYGAPADKRRKSSRTHRLGDRAK
jgi:TetR/AcrR family transcriptional regulator, tetracycline repressor protein